MVLNKDSPPWAHTAQNLGLLVLSVLLLPIDTFILILSFILRPKLAPDHSSAKMHEIKSRPSFRPRTILVTGVGMTKGLALARLFHSAGHRVIGADFERNGALVCGRVSRALNKFYPMSKPEGEDSTKYIQDLLRIIKHERVDLWVSCSGVASAVSDGEAKEVIESETRCKAIQYDVKTTETLHEKHTFIEHTASLGLTVPETHVVTDRGAVRDIFANAKGKQFIMKTIAVDDANRGDMTLLPRPSHSETEKALSRVNASEANPWIAQQYINGREYCTHALVIRGQVKAFVACPSLELLMHYEALPSTSPLSRAMLTWTKTFAADGGDTFTGHLSFDFLVEAADEKQQDPEKITLYPIECNPRAHTAVALFNDTPELVDAYLSLLDNDNTTATSSSSKRQDGVIVPKTPAKYYWVGHDLVTCVFVPLLDCIRGSGAASLSDVMDGVRDFRAYVFGWRDGTYEVWDPLPWWWLYHVYWPVQFFNSLVRGQRWSRVNVSTTKMFLC